MYKAIITELQKLSSPEKAFILQRFFKTWPGQYGEGDIFLGITVPQTRSVVKEFLNSVSLEDIEKLLENPYHEVRLCGALLLVAIFGAISKGKYLGTWFSTRNASEERIADFYLKNSRRMNNWDLVDLSAPNVLWTYLFSHPEKLSVLTRLVGSENLWERRIAIISTFAFIKNGEYRETFRMVELLLKDSHDLIHKANGWMLREVGKRISEELLESFLEEHASHMPRTTLRYAIERLSAERRAYWMSRKLVG